MLAPWKESYDKSKQCIKKKRYRFADTGLYSQSCDFSGSHVLMWELDHKEGWAVKSWHFWVLVLEKTLESPLESKGIKAINPKGDQPWIFTGRTDAEAEVPILRLPDAKSWLIGKTLCWERLRVRGDGGNRGWDGWMASLTHWTWIWANYGR